MSSRDLIGPSVPVTDLVRERLAEQRAAAPNPPVLDRVREALADLRTPAPSPREG